MRICLFNPYDLLYSGWVDAPSGLRLNRPTLCSRLPSGLMFWTILDWRIRLPPIRAKILCGLLKSLATQSISKSIRRTNCFVRDLKKTISPQFYWPACLLPRSYRRQILRRIVDLSAFNNIRCKSQIMVRVLNLIPSKVIRRYPCRHNGFQCSIALDRRIGWK